MDNDFHLHSHRRLQQSPPPAMTERHIEIRTELAASEKIRVDIGQDGVLHVLAGPITLHLDRATCEELTTTLARAMVTLARSRRPRLRLVSETTGSPCDARSATRPAPGDGVASRGSGAASDSGSEQT